MTLLMPIGLIALASILALIIIYIIKPNFQQKVLSSTYIWRLSLKYRKKRIPLSKLRNLLLILCQILILVCCTAAIVKPSKILLMKDSGAEVIIVIDSSASMRAGTDESGTRYQRAVYEAMDVAADVFANDGKVSVIIADENPHYLCKERMEADQQGVLMDNLKQLVSKQTECGYYISDIDSAMELCEDIVAINDNALIYLYTDKKYVYPVEGIIMPVITDEDEWNVGILNARTEIEENYYSVYVDLGCYGKNTPVTLVLEIYGANEEKRTIRLEAEVDLYEHVTKTVVFNNNETSMDYPESESMEYFVIPDNNKVYSYDYIYVYLTDGEDYFYDSFLEDDSFEIYGGRKEPLSIIYVSPNPSTFVNSILYSFVQSYSKNWDISVSEERSLSKAPTSGKDFYIYELLTPEILPADGVSFVIAPSRMPVSSGLTACMNPVMLTDGIVGLPLTQVKEHPIMKNVSAGKIEITQFYPVMYNENILDCVMSYEQYPVLLCCNNSQMKTIFMCFDMHYSNLPLVKEFPLLMMNIFEYYFPPTIPRNAYEIGDIFEINARSYELTVTGYNYENVFTGFPAKLKLNYPGTYTFKQKTFGGVDITEKVYIKIPAVESDIWAEEDTLYNPYQEIPMSNYYKDLFIYFAIALTALMFAEWLLQIKDNM